MEFALGLIRLTPQLTLTQEGLIAYGLKIGVGL